MDILLSIIGVLGVGALVISAYVFVGAAKRYVSGEDLQDEMVAMQADLPPRRHWIERAEADRRQNTQPVLFPITIDGVFVPEDRRVQSDRRRVA